MEIETCQYPHAIYIIQMFTKWPGILSRPEAIMLSLKKKKLFSNLPPLCLGTYQNDAHKFDEVLGCERKLTW